MKYLIDTHTVLWFLNGNKELSSKAKGIIEDQENEINLSIASLWEIAIKESLGKLNFPKDLNDVVNDIEELNINILNIKKEHILELLKLEFFHKDPFDRVIISQAKLEKLKIIGKDEIFDKYNVKRIW